MVATTTETAVNEKILFVIVKKLIHETRKTEAQREKEKEK